MITRQIAIDSYVGQIFYHRSLRNADGSPLRCRVNGKCKIWKTRMGWRLPVKHGLKQCFYIGVVACEILELPDVWYEFEWSWLLERTPWEKRLDSGGLLWKEWLELGGVIADWLDEHDRASDATALRGDLVRR